MELNDDNIDNNLIEVFQNILKKEKITTNSKQDQLEIK